MDSGEENSNLEIKDCFVKVKKLSMEDFDSDSSSSIDLPPLPFLIPSKSSKKKAAKSSAELLEEHQKLAKNIQIENLSSSNIEETLRTLEVVHTEEVGGSTSSSTPVVSPQERNDFKIFFNNNSLQFFTADDVTPLECGYKDWCLESFPVKVYEEKMLSFKRVELQHALSSFLFSSNVCCISDCKSFATYLMRVMSVYEDVACVKACYNTLIMLLKEHPEARTMTFNSSEIFMFLFNYGVDVDEFPFLEKWPNFKKSLESPQWQRKISNRIPDQWAFNLRFILQVTMELIPCCSFKTKDLSKIAIFFLYMSLDPILLQENLYSLVRECIYVCLENVPKDDWIEIVCEIDEMLMSMEFSSVQQKWNNTQHMLEAVPNRCQRGIQLRKHISFSALKLICCRDTSDFDENSADFTVNDLHKYLQKLVEVDSHLLSYATKFVDICIQHLSLSKEDYNLLCSSLKKCEKCFDKSSHEVTTHLIKIHTKLRHFGRKFTFKVSDNESHIKIKKEVEEESETGSGPSIVNSASIKIEPVSRHPSSRNKVNEYDSENDSQDDNFHSLSSSESENSNVSHSSSVKVCNDLHIKTENIVDLNLPLDSTENKPPIKLVLKRKERSSRSHSTGSSIESNMLNTVLYDDDMSKQSSYSEYELVNNPCLPQEDAVTLKTEISECPNSSLYSVPVKEEPKDYCESVPVPSVANELDFTESAIPQNEISEMFDDESLVQHESKLPEICEVRSIFESNADMINSSSFDLRKPVDDISQDKKVCPAKVLETSLSDSKSFGPNMKELSISPKSCDQMLPTDDESQLPEIYEIKTLDSFSPIKNVSHAPALKLPFPDVKPVCSNDLVTREVTAPLPNADDEIIIIQEKASPIKSKNSSNSTKSFIDERYHSAGDTDIVIIKVVESPKKNKENTSPKKNPTAAEEWVDHILCVTECDIQTNDFETTTDDANCQKIDSDDSEILLIDAKVPTEAFIPICREVLNTVLDTVEESINANIIHSVVSTLSHSVDVDTPTEKLPIQADKMSVANSNSVTSSTQSLNDEVNDVYEQKDKICKNENLFHFGKVVTPIGNLNSISDEDEFLYSEDNLDNVKPSDKDFVERDKVCDIARNENISLDEMCPDSESEAVKKSDLLPKDTDNNQLSISRLSNKELPVDAQSVFPNPLKMGLENIVESKKKEHSRKQSKPLKRKHETEILMLDFDRNKKDRIDKNVTDVVNDLLSSSVILSESSDSQRIPVSNCNVIDSKVYILSKAHNSSECNNSSQPETDIFECVSSLVNEVDGSSLSDSITSGIKEDKFVSSDSQIITARKTFQNRTISKKNLGKFSGARKSIQKRSKMNEEMSVMSSKKPFHRRTDVSTACSSSRYNSNLESSTSLSKSSEVQKSLPNSNKTEKHILSKVSGARKSFQKRKNTELLHSSFKMQKYDYESTTYRNENEHDQTLKNKMYRSPKKLSPQKSPLSAKYCMNKSPTHFYNYKQKYYSSKKTNYKSILNKTGLNLTNVLKEKVMPFDSNSKPVVLSDSDDSDIVELYTDPKKYRDKECLVVYESEDIVVLD